MVQSQPTKSALITGGASGMGLAVSRSLVAQGWMVSILDASPETCRIAEQVLGPKSSGHQVDVTNYEQLSKAFASVWNINRGIDFGMSSHGLPSKCLV
jgi:15-hydroxyprostaglandin dehydrogenase (NAD)